jgi:hypothetical protein
MAATQTARRIGVDVKLDILKVLSNREPWVTPCKTPASVGNVGVEAYT